MSEANAWALRPGHRIALGQEVLDGQAGRDPARSISRAAATAPSRPSPTALPARRPGQCPGCRLELRLRELLTGPDGDHTTPRSAR